MRDACAVPNVAAGALMPDAHVGYGLPIGGVLATRQRGDSVCRRRRHRLPHEAVGARHAGRGRSTESNKASCYDNALEKGTRFGVGGEYQQAARARGDGPGLVPSRRITRENKDKAWRQLGTSGSGNHFVEFGLLTLDEPTPNWACDAGEYVALLSHSGSRGTGAAVCSVYSDIARQRAAEAVTPTSADWLGSISTTRRARSIGPR